MITSEFQNIAVTGVLTAVPVRRVDNMDFAESFGKETVEKIIQSTGIRESYACGENQTVGDLCYVAARRLLEEKNIDPASIDVLLYCSYCKDYYGPATAFVIQHRLGIPMDCIVYDIGIGCSGFVYGLQTMASLLTCSSAERGLLLVGDSTSKCASPLDKSRMLFGDAGAAVLVEKAPDAAPMRFAMRSDGNRFKAIIIPAGEDRKWDADPEPSVWYDGNTRSDYNLFINGADVFSFSITDVPRLILDFMERYGVRPEDCDCLLLHQANTFIIKHLARKVKFSMDKVPLSLDRYGNSSGTTIPLTMCDAYGNVPGKHIHALMSGFGVGLSWAVAEADFNTADVYPIIHTDDYFKDGGMRH